MQSVSSCWFDFDMCFVQSLNAMTMSNNEPRNEKSWHTAVMESSLQSK